MNAQEIVAANVAARGYRDGWTVDEFVARQFCKLTEELDEAAGNINPPRSYEGVQCRIDLHMAGQNARAAFDDKGSWVGVYLGNLDAIRSELPDMLVVILAAAAALDFDVVQAAIDKSASDVARGVR